MWKRSGSLVLVVLAFCDFSSALTIQDVPKLVSAKNEEVLGARKDIEAAEAGVSAARAKYLPTLNWRNTYVHLGSDIRLKVPPQQFNIANLATINVDLPPVDIQKRDVFLSSLVAKWPIFTGGRITANYSAAKAAEDEARAQNDKVTQEKTHEAMVRYFSVQLARNLSQTLGRMRENLVRVQTMSESLLKTGLGTRFNTLQIKAAIAELDSRLVEANGKAELADLAFKNSVGMSTAEIVSYDSPLVSVDMPDDSAKLKTTALSKRKEFVVLDAKSRQASALKSAHTGELLPTVAALGQYRLLASNTPLLESPVWAVGVVVDVPLMSWIGAIPEMEKAIRIQEKVEILQARAKQEIPLQMEKLYVQAKTLKASLAAIDESIEMSREALRLAEVRFKNGNGSALEVLQSNTELQKVEVRRTQLVEEYNRALLDLYLAAGDIDLYLRSYGVKKDG